MNKNNLLKNAWLVAVASLMLGMTSGKTFAEHRDHHWGRREHIRHGSDRYDYHEGRFYRMSLFGAILDMVFPPAGITVTYLPRGHRTIYIGGVRYYEYDNIYYQSTPGGYIVVQQPMVTQYVSPNVVYIPAANVAIPAQVQVTGDRETIIFNVPRINGGYVAITLVRYSNGFVGPQGEFYPTLPTGAELIDRYGN